MVFGVIREAFNGGVTSKRKPTGMKWNKKSTRIVWLGSQKQTFCLHLWTTFLHVKVTGKRGSILHCFISTVTTMWICSHFYNFSQKI